MTPAGNATVDLTSTGEHTLDAWMREDGLRVDRVLLVTDTNHIPTGLGPAESPFQTITETIPGGLGTTSISYGHDDLYRLTDAAYTGAITATFAYDYDSVGNMTAFTETVDAQTTSVTRSFDVANRLEYAVDASGTTTYTYDANGNLIQLLPPGATGANPVGGLRYDYDQRNLMVSHETNPDGAGWVLQAEYVYDGANDRLRQVDGNSVANTGATPITTTYTNDIFGLTQMLVAGDGTNEVYNLFGLDLISQDSGSEVRTLLVDGLGSVRLEMVGAVVETTTTYKPYGEVLEQAGMSGTVYGFTGEQEDSATGLLYLRPRYYDSSLKTFMSRDPWEGTGWRPMTLHWYLYVIQNPVNFTDPGGRNPNDAEFNPRDLTSWLYREMMTNVNDSRLRRVRSANRTADTALVAGTAVALAGTCTAILPIAIAGLVVDAGAVAVYGAAFLQHYALVGDQQTWDFKHMINERLGRGITLCSVSGCKSNIEYSVPGNIHFFAGGRLP